MNRWILATMFFWSLIALLSGGLGCNEETNGVQPVGNLVDYEPPAPVELDQVGLPVLDNGNLLAFTTSGINLEINPEKKDALTALGGCAEWISGCFEPGSRSLDDCVRSSPECATNTPWDESEWCCPLDCKQGYYTLRWDDVEDYVAVTQVLFEDGSCMPGLTALLGGGS
jgi:hypothetical protein